MSDITFSDIKKVPGKIVRRAKKDYNKLVRTLDPDLTLPATEKITSDIKKNVEEVKSKVKGVLKHHSAEDGKFLTDRKKKFGV